MARGGDGVARASAARASAPTTSAAPTTATSACPDPDERLHANNLYFETLASLGLAGVGALALVIVGFAGAAPGARSAATAPRRPRVCSPPGAAAGLAAYLVHGFFDYFLEFTPTYALLWLLGGMLAALAATR